MVCVPSFESRSVIEGKTARFCTCIRTEMGEVVKRVEIQEESIWFRQDSESRVVFVNVQNCSFYALLCCLFSNTR